MKKHLPYLLTAAGTLFLVATFILIPPIKSALDEEFSEVPDTSESITLMFAGDMMFDRYIRKMGERNGYEKIFETLTPLLERADLVIANLEGPITSQPTLHRDISESTPYHYTFTFDPTIAEILSDTHIQLVSLGNNHILNFGSNGRDETAYFLDQAQVSYFGLPEGEQEKIMTIKGNTISFVSFNQFSDDSTEKTASLIHTLKEKSDVVIVFAHWGEEYQREATNVQRTNAHTFIDAGADLVVGAHPHVIQHAETYKGVTIYYSLGNFVFDQYFNDDVRCGLILEISVANGEVTVVEEHGVELIEDGTTQPSQCHITHTDQA